MLEKLRKFFSAPVFEDKEKLRRQAEQMSALYDIGLTITSNLELDQILQGLFEKCVQLLPIDTFYIAIYDEATRIIRHPLYYDWSRKTFIQVEDRNIETAPGLSGYVILSKATLHLQNLDDPVIQEKYKIVPTASVPSRSYVGVPMLFHDTVIGAISMQSYQPDAYSPEQIRLLETIATQAAIAIENARLYQVEQERRREADTLRESLTSIVTIFELEEVVERILDQIKFVIPYDTASVWRVDGEWLIPIVTRDLPLEISMADFRLHFDGDNSSRPLMRGEKPYILNNNIQGERTDFNGPHSYINSWLAVPLKKRGKIIGQIALDGRKEGQFTEHHAELAVTFADQVAIALENASLYEEIQQELSERKRAEETLRQRDEILQAVAYAAQVFLQSPNWRERINNVLSELGKATDASHVYIFENHVSSDEKRFTSQRYEWASVNSKPEIDNPAYQNVPLFGEGQKYWSGMLGKGQTFVGNMATLPKDEAEYFQERGIKSILDVPIFVGGAWWGVMGFDDYFNERTWSPAEIEALEVAAKMISAAIESEETNESIRVNEERYRTIFENSPVSLLEEDFSDIKTYIDNLKSSGVKDFKEYFKTHPEEAKRCSNMVRIVDVNKTILEWYGIKDKTEFHKHLGQVLDPIEYESFIDELLVLMQGKGRYKLAVSRRSRREGLVHLVVNGTVVPGFEDSWERVLVSIMDITESKRVEEALLANEEKVKELNTSLEKRVVERTEQLHTEKARIEQVVNEVATLRRLSDFLQASMTVEEACKIIVSHMSLLFSGTTGALYLTGDGFADLNLMVHWGEFMPETVIQPNDCWGMRRGRVFVRYPSDASPACSHLGTELSRESMCLPLLAQNETIGMLCMQVSGNAEKYFASDAQNLAVASADSIALALANLRLRERLHNQSVRDPLTGLFNRRYLEETLARETHRAGRSQSPLCVIMFEVDNFKVYNNTFGHDAGDYVLRKVADTMRVNLRRSDFPCRYGGDEFTLLLPETSLEDGAHRAEELRKSIEVLALSYNNQALGQVTVRMGVAAYPKHGETGEAVLKVADDASYRARAIGKNCVVVAE